MARPLQLSGSNRHRPWVVLCDPATVVMVEVEEREPRRYWGRRYYCASTVAIVIDNAPAIADNDVVLRGLYLW